MVNYGLVLPDHRRVIRKARPNPDNDDDDDSWRGAKFRRGGETQNGPDNKKKTFFDSTVREKE